MHNETAKLLLNLMHVDMIAISVYDKISFMGKLTMRLGIGG